MANEGRVHLFALLIGWMSDFRKSGFTQESAPLDLVGESTYRVWQAYKTCISTYKEDTEHDILFVREELEDVIRLTQELSEILGSDNFPYEKNLFFRYHPLLHREPRPSEMERYQSDLEKRVAQIMGWYDIIRQEATQIFQQLMSSKGNVHVESKLVFPETVETEGGPDLISATSFETGKVQMIHSAKEVDSLHRMETKKKPISGADDKRNDFAFFLVPKQRILLPLLIEEFQNLKPREYAYMLFALEKLGYLNIALRDENKNKLHKALKNSFGKVGTRESLRSNIIRLHNTSLDVLQVQIRNFTEKISSLVA